MWHIAGNWSTKRHLKFYIIYKDRTVLQIQPITTSCCRFNLSPYYAADSTYHHIMLQIQPITTLCCRLNLSPYYAADSTYHHTTLQIRPIIILRCRFDLLPDHAADSSYHHIMLQIQPFTTSCCRFNLSNCFAIEQIIWSMKHIWLQTPQRWKPSLLCTNAT